MVTKSNISKSLILTNFRGFFVHYGSFWVTYSMIYIKWKDSLFCHEGLNAALWTNWWRFVSTLGPLRSKDRILSHFCHQIWLEIWERTCELQAGPIFEKGKILTKKLPILCRIMYYWRFKSNFWKIKFSCAENTKKSRIFCWTQIFQRKFFQEFFEKDPTKS